jgi:hypothetical protein
MPYLQDIQILKLFISFSVPAPFKPPGAPHINPTVPFPNESSIWEVYVNESVVIDNELVKDWTSSLNFLLVFVSCRTGNGPVHVTDDV